MKPSLTRNARKSTGPTSAKGKSASAANALKHGAYAATASAIPRGHFAEDQEEVDAYLTAIVTSMAPRDDLEYEQAGRIARYFLRFRRLGLLEAEALAGDTAEDDGTGRELAALLSSRNFDDVDRERAAHRALNSAMEQATRIDARIGRSLEQAIIVYYELQRRELPNGIGETNPILEPCV